MVRALRTRGIDFSVITDRVPGAPDFELVEGVPVTRLPLNQAIESRDAAAIVEARARIQALQAEASPDLIHSIVFGPVAFFTHALSSSGTPCVFEVSLDLTQEAADPHSAMGRAVRQANWVVTGSQTALDNVRATFPEIESRSSFIHCGVDLPTLEPTTVSLDPPHLLTLGRLDPGKGIDVAVLALAHIVQRAPDARLTIAGEGELRAPLEAWVQDLGLGESVHFAGRVSPESVPRLLDEASLVWMPSRCEETFGLVAVEAALMARPVVASRVGGLREIVAQDKTGLLVAKDDPEALAEATLDLLAHPKRAAEMGARARANAIERFSVSTYATHYEQLYRRVASTAAIRADSNTPTPWRVAQ